MSFSMSRPSDFRAMIERDKNTALDIAKKEGLQRTEVNETRDGGRGILGSFD